MKDYRKNGIGQSPEMNYIDETMRLKGINAELLKALERIEVSLRLDGEPTLASQCYQLETARAAIKKAKGE